MKQLLDSILPTLLPVLASAISAGLLWALNRLSAYLKAKAAQAGANAIQAEAFGAFDQLDAIAAATVQHLNAEVKEKLTGGGPLNDAQKAELKALAMNALTNEAGPQVVKVLRGLLGDLFETVVSGAIEKAVAAAKPAAKVSP